jgi:hypothetical protein
MCQQHLCVLASTLVRRQAHFLPLCSIDHHLKRTLLSFLQGSELGEGSFATVEECVLRGRRVAVKRLRCELLTNLDEVECFLAEGMTVSKLDHP